MIQHNHFLRRLWAIALFLLMAESIHAQLSQSTRFINVSLPYASNEIEQVWQDHQGMIWLITRHGVFTYDGYNARRIIGGNYYAATALSKDILILGSDNGLRFLDIRSGQMCNPLGEVPQTGDIRSLALSRGTLYVGTKLNGLFCYDFRRRLWQRYAVSNNKDDIIYAIQPVSQGVYLGHIGGVSFVDRRGNIHATDIRDNVYSLGLDRRRGCLWVGAEHSFLRRDLRTGSTTAVLSGSTYNHFFLLPSGNLLVSSEYGMVLLNPDSRTSTVVSHDAASPMFSLPSNRINAFFLDRQNNIWIATDRGASLARQTVNFEYTNLADITHSRVGNTFTNVLIDSRGNRWLGGENGILLLTKKGYKWFRTDNGLKKNIIRCIYEDRDHEIWIATDASIARYNPNKNSFDYYTLTDNKGRSSYWAYALYEDARGRLWVGTYMGGLYVVDKKALLKSNGSYKMPRLPFAHQDDLVNVVYRLVPDDNGNLWAYTGKGLTFIDTRHMRATVKRKIYPDGMTVAGGSVWIDLQGHLYRYDIRTDALSNTGFAIANGMIFSFVKDQGRVWMSTTNGLYTINLKDNTIHPASKPEYKLTAGFRDPATKTILWGGEDIVAWQRTNVSRDIVNSKVYVTEATVDGKEYDGASPRFVTDLRLDGRHNIILHLSTYDYSNRNSEVFWYKIGATGQWQSLPAGTNTISLSELSGGNHELFLSVNPQPGNDSLYVLHVPFPWYMRWWAWMLYLVMAISIVYGLLVYGKRRTQQRLKEQERENALALTEQKMDFFVEMSHELKTPLSLIIAPLEKLLADTTNASMRTKIKYIHDNAMRLNGIIHRILDFKRMEAEGDDKILDSHVDLVSLIHDSVNEFAPSASERHISLTFQTDLDSLWMDIDIVKIQAVMRNLLSNAMKYVSDNTGMVAVKVSLDNNKAIVKICDNGPGVQKDDLGKIFNRYYKGDEQHNGTGIGLAVVKKYVELHGGDVSAENDNGLTVSFSLPIRKGASATTERADEEPKNNNKPNVLVVDDNHEIVDFLTSAFKDNYTVTAAYSGEEALQSLKEAIPDLIITDQMMPGMDGTELCKALRQNHSTTDTPIIMLTAKDDRETEMKSISCGADVFMPKPFNLQKLQLHMVQLLKRRNDIIKKIHINAIAEKPYEKEGYENNDERLIADVMKAINDNMAEEDFNVAKLCQLLNIDQKQLYRKLKKLTGKTPVSFIREQRLKRAANLLKQGQLTVSEVMYQVGFSSLSYFNKSFTEMYSVSPKDYRTSSAHRSE